MKTFTFVLLICCASIGTDLFSQTLPNSFTGTRWKVKEFYINKAPVRSTKIDSLRFLFAANGMLRLGMNSGNNAPSVHYFYNPKDSLITFDDAKLRSLLYKVLYFDNQNLILEQNVPANQDQVTRIEYRMIQDH